MWALRNTIKPRITSYNVCYTKLLRVFGMYRLKLIERGIITHPFTAGNLQANPEWPLLYSLVGLLLLAGVWVAAYGFKKDLHRKFHTLLITSLAFIFLSITLFTPGAERISQKAAIDFIKEKAREDVYIHSFYKSYAVLFYSNRGIPDDKRAFSTQWLTSKEIDKDAYFVMRIDKKAEILNRYPNIEVLYEKNGYVFAVNHAHNQEIIAP